MSYRDRCIEAVIESVKGHGLVAPGDFEESNIFHDHVDFGSGQFVLTAFFDGCDLEDFDYIDKVKVIGSEGNYLEYEELYTWSVDDRDPPNPGNALDQMVHKLLVERQFKKGESDGGK